MSVDSMYEEMKRKLSRVVPDFELRYKAELAEEINQLKKEKNAVILGHNYMEPALYYSIPDFRGDSLDLSRKAAQTDKDIIVFCGVRFMAETAKLLNPTKTVLLPSEKAGCSLAASITAEDVRQLRARYPGVPAVAYVNTYANVKAEVDICCTSSNAKAVVESLHSDTVIFLPDEYLARNVAKDTGRHIIFPTLQDGKTSTELDYQQVGSMEMMVGWHGRCEVHEKFTVKDIEAVRQQFPEVVILSHPECSPEVVVLTHPESRPDVVAASDFSGGTNAMIRYVKESNAQNTLFLPSAPWVIISLPPTPKKTCYGFARFAART